MILLNLSVKIPPSVKIRKLIINVYNTPEKSSKEAKKTAIRARRGRSRTKTVFVGLVKGYMKVPSRS